MLLHRFLVLAWAAASLPAQSAPTTTAAAGQAVAEAILHAEFVPTEQEVFGHVRFLACDAMAGRSAGSPQGAIAAAYVAAELAKLGLQPAGTDAGFEQRFERVHGFIKRDGAKAGDAPVLEPLKVTCRNVLAWLPGTDNEVADEFILLGAHYDHLGQRGDEIFNGADDNASGVAGMLAVARALVRGDHKPRRSVLFVAFDAEERGIAGSETFARKPPRSLQKLVTMINLDMIGRRRLLDRKDMAFAKRLVGIPDAPAVGVLGTSQSPELAAIAHAVFAADELPLFAPENFGVLASVIEKQAAGRSDHAPFERRKIPFLFFSTSENDDYHQPTDTLDKVDAATLWRISRCVYRTVLAVDALPARPSFVGTTQDQGDDADEKGKDGAAEANHSAGKRR